jgi:thymidylate synthase
MHIRPIEPVTADDAYQSLLGALLQAPIIHTRNAPTHSLIHVQPIQFDRTPLVTWRETAWEKSLRELAWHLSGDPYCPEEFQQTWWKGQLSPDGHYYSGYAEQLGPRYCGPSPVLELIAGLRDHAHSRRHVLTTWHNREMQQITRVNRNANTPTTCHGTLIMLWVRDGVLHMDHTQRSADMMLGVPHNFIQYWALLLWLAHCSGHAVGTLTWHFGDLHLYAEESHIEAAKAIVAAELRPCEATLRYVGKGGLFKAADFVMDGEIPDAVTTIRPRLL